MMMMMMLMRMTTISESGCMAIVRAGDILGVTGKGMGLPLYSHRHPLMILMVMVMVTLVMNIMIFVTMMILKWTYLWPQKAQDTTIPVNSQLGHMSELITPRKKGVMSPALGFKYPHNPLSPPLKRPINHLLDQLNHSLSDT